MEALSRAITTAAPADKGRLERFRGLLSAPGWLTNISNQTHTVIWLQGIQSVTHPVAWKACLRALATVLDISEERARTLVHLPTVPQITRALQPRPPIPPRKPPDQVYPTTGWLGDYLDYSAGNECPTAFHFWTAASVLGATCRRNFFIDMGAYTIYPNLYALLIAPSGGRKGFSLTIATNVLKALNKILSDQGVHPAELINISPKKVGPERFLYIAQSEEKLDAATGRTSYTDSIVFFGISELAVLLGKSVFHSEHFVHVLTDLWECHDEWQASTFSRGEEILRNTAITLVGCSTEDWLLNSVSTDMFTGGFMGRCMTIPRGYTKDLYPIPHTLDPIAAITLASRLSRLATAPQTPVTIGDMKHYDSWYVANKQILHTQTDPRLAGYYQRKDMHLLKLGMILALSEGQVTIRTPHLVLADRILSHEESFLPTILARIGEHPKARVASLVLGKIQHLASKAPDGLVSRSSLSRSTFAATGGATNLDRALESLLANRAIEVFRDRKARVTYYLIPQDSQLDEGPEE